MQQLTLTHMQVEKDYTSVDYACDFTATTAGDGLWGCEAGREIKVTGISVVTNCYDNEMYITVNVAHNSTWEIYTDTGFETAISEALGFAVSFTEQGMQEDNCASMEA